MNKPCVSPNLASLLLQVLPSTLASQYFVPGDIVLGIQGHSARDLLHMEAVDLVRQPVKSLELLVQKAEHTPASIWGPEPVLKRPAEWLRQSLSPATNAYPKFKVGYRPTSVQNNHFDAVSHSGLQQQPSVRAAYTPTALDSRLTRNGFETPGKIPQTRHQASSAIRQVASDFNQAFTTDISHYCDNTQYLNSKIPKGKHNLQTPRGSYEMSSDTPEQTNHMYGYQLQERFQYTNKSVRSTHPQMAQNVHLKQEHIQNDPDNPNRNVAENTKEQRSRDAGECKVRPVTERPRISATSDILKRPISPEFTTFPNSKSNSLLKLVLSKSLLNYSPQDFEKMKASVAETSDESEGAEDSDTEEDEDVGSTSCDSSLATSGSAIFERYWVAENEEGELSDDSELRQYTSPRSLGRNSSATSASSLFSDSTTSTSDNYTG
ncbi:hypothetical protein B7P43_G09376 [Cryptotermes secundus]|uniref:PDZ domain-containing protein n=1 Tax=Cryptotermes secundus TaxID=105785 RepID=A0A2J7QJ36_9NEOP|nr:hypothetical protein B7P43_G09376 [Cryptotermes secundus]